MRIGWTEASVLITTVGVILSTVETVTSALRRTWWRGRLSRALEMDRTLPDDRFDGLRAVLAADIRDSAARLERIESRRVRRLRARSRGAPASALVVIAAALAALFLPAAPAVAARPFGLFVASTLALIALVLAVRRDVQLRQPFLKPAADSTDPLPRRPTLLAIWRWFPSGFSDSVDGSEDTITARVSPPGQLPDAHWRQEAFPSR